MSRLGTLPGRLFSLILSVPQFSKHKTEMKKFFTGLLAAICFATSMASFTGCAPKGGLATDSGNMSIEEFQRLKDEEQKAISQGMQDATKKK